MVVSQMNVIVTASMLRATFKSKDPIKEKMLDQTRQLIKGIQEKFPNSEDERILVRILKLSKLCNNGDLHKSVVSFVEGYLACESKKAKNTMYVKAQVLESVLIEWGNK